MTNNCRTETEQLTASAEGEEEATPNPERGEGDCRPARRFELSVGTGGIDGGNSTIDLGEAVKFGRCVSDCSIGDFPDPTPDGPFVDASPIPSAAGRGARSISGLRAAADKGSAISGELGRLVQ